MKNISNHTGVNSFGLYAVFKCFIQILCTIGIIIITVSCNKSSTNNYKLLRVYGNGFIANISKSNVLFSTPCSMVSPVGILFSDGDLLYIEDWMVQLPYKTTENNTALRFITSDSLLLIDNKVAGIRLDTNYRMSTLLLSIDTVSIKDLKLLLITQDGFTKYRKQLEKIASLNSAINLQLDESLQDQDLAALFNMFNPAYLSGTFSQSQFALLKTEEQLTALYINLKNENNLVNKPIPSLPSLKNLSIDYNSGDSVTLTNQLLKNNPQVECLSLTNFNDAIVSGVLKPLVHLRELVLLGIPVSAGEILAHKTSIERALIDSVELQLQLPHLRWATVGNTDSSHSMLENMLKQNPTIEVLEILAEEEFINLKSINLLKQLESLTITDADSINLEPVKEMKQLKLLSYSTHSGNDDSTLAVLKTSLPNTLVVPNEGFCVGSGWLLLLLPAMTLVLVWASKSTKHTSTGSFKNSSSI